MTLRLGDIAPAMSDAEAEKAFPKGFKKVKPYLRTTPPPPQN